MDRLTTVAAAREWRAGAGASVGFAPTMGALHDGHLSLVRRARAENERVLVSIFVNPLQFGPDEDLDRYPRDLDGDCRALEAAGVDAVFLPTAEQMYPPGFSTTVEVTGPLTERLEAASRPGHFAGVTTVVTKLMQIAQATRTYFGMKDAQQLLVLAKLVRDLMIPTVVVPVPTVREADGLAMSSRNAYLSAEERKAALAISRGLGEADTLFAGGERRGAELRGVVEAELKREPLLRPEYVSCASLETLEELDGVGEAALLSVAVRAGKTRLIDNAWLGLREADLPQALRSSA